MANVIRIKRRVSGAAGAPVALKSAELAHNEVDDTLYVGKGDDGGAHDKLAGQSLPCAAPHAVFFGG